jgi:nucleoside-diphosphate-sugar epimerase
MSDASVGDLLEPDSLVSACSGVESVFHCAGYAHAFASSDPDAHWRINFEGTRNLVEAAGRAGTRRFVFLSSVKAMAEPGDACADEDWPGEPETPYGRAKRAAEECVQETGSRYGMHVVNLRLAMVYGHGGRGNLERMARGIAAGWFPPLPETANRRSLVHVSDVVDAIRLVAVKTVAKGKTYIVADSQAYSGREIYDAICIALRKPIPNRRISANMLRLAGRIGDMAGTLTRKSPLPLNAEVVARLLDSSCYSPARIERELGWRSRVSLHTGIKEMLAPDVESPPAFRSVNLN